MNLSESSNIIYLKKQNAEFKWTFDYKSSK